MQPYNTKVEIFQEYRVYKQHPPTDRSGSEPIWEMVDSTAPISQQIGDWVDTNDVRVLTVSPPGYSQSWTDPEKTKLIVTLGASIVFAPLETYDDYRTVPYLEPNI